MKDNKEWFIWYKSTVLNLALYKSNSYHLEDNLKKDIELKFSTKLGIV